MFISQLNRVLSQIRRPRRLFLYTYIALGKLKIMFCHHKVQVLQLICFVWKPLKLHRFTRLLTFPGWQIFVFCPSYATVITHLPFSPSTPVSTNQKNANIGAYENDKPRYFLFVITFFHKRLVIAQGSCWLDLCHS